ncbi:transposon Ty3-I Gag-Pol polyprotein [Elysia marginata]|uniref:Transposon Ty3-I Gag-Pol polyprotein n=1 Tax=Elysia marginata TaxID=1093978 RepID=A0AAV4ESK3_9GAST|nr:transposon Ty3-I Gag-Pol polyprotein [Elysia marginata]
MTALLHTNGHEVRFQIDTGTDVNIICKKFVKREQAMKTTQVLKMWNKTKVKPEGEAILRVTNPKTQETIEVRFTIVKNDFSCLLSLKTSREPGLLTINTDKFIARLEADSSNAIGDLGEAQLTVDPSIKPTVLPCRKIPHALKEIVKTEKETLLQRGNLEKTHEPTPWVNQMAVVSKPNGKLGLCIDPQPLNKALQREHFRLPTFDDVIPELQNAKVFSKLDVQEAYWACETGQGIEQNDHNDNALWISGKVEQTALWS